MNKETVFIFNAQTDISDYKNVTLDGEALDAIIKNCTATIVLGKTGKGKNTFVKKCEFLNTIKTG